MYLPPFLRSKFKQYRMTSFYRQFINADDLCFDIGAHTGERTEIFLKLGASVIAIEPQQSCTDVLLAKFGENRKVKIVRSAVGSHDGEAQLMICNETAECSTLSSEFVSVYNAVSGFTWTKKEKVNLVTMQTLIEKYGVAKFCKIDVEGFEQEVFKGLKMPVEYIAFEFNRPLLQDTIMCLRLLYSLGPCTINFIRFETMKLALKEWMEVQDFIRDIEKLIAPDVLTGEIMVHFREM